MVVVNKDMTLYFMTAPFALPKDENIATGRHIYGQLMRDTPQGSRLTVNSNRTNTHNMIGYTTHDDAEFNPLSVKGLDIRTGTTKN